ncbi:hypothetical protein JXB12_00940 [candidate division KSB1 bacterium]|nr:hypothetical protein [candidate division KSB1 bacterium]
MKRILLIIFLLVLFISPVYSQIMVTSGTLHDEISIFFLSDLNLSGLGESPLLFYLDITNSYGEEKSVLLDLRMVYEGNFMSSVDLIAGQTGPLNIIPGTTRITNQNLFSDTDPYRLLSFDLNDQAVDKLIDQLLASGKLPTGDYRFIITLAFSDGSGSIDQTDLYYNITNTETIDLISPGNPACEGDLRQIYTTLPLFRWESDALKFRIKVCEKLQTNNSPEDVMNNEPRLLTEVENKFLQYPITGAFMLEEGKAYYWQVWSIVNTSSGIIEIPSEIWGFQISEMGGGSNSFQQQQIMNVLRMILGDDVVNDLFAEGGMLCNHTSTGIMMEDGDVISMDRLIELSKEFSKGTYNVKNYSIE